MQVDNNIAILLYCCQVDVFTHVSTLSMKISYTRLYLNEAKSYIESLPLQDQAKIRAAFLVISEGDFISIETKMLKSPVRELKIKKHRITFFIKQSTLYILTGFLKQTAKTPKRELDKAYTLYKLLIT